MELKKVFKKIKAYICGSCDNCINRNFCGEHKLPPCGCITGTNPNHWEYDESTN